MDKNNQEVPNEGLETFAEKNSIEKGRPNIQPFEITAKTLLEMDIKEVPWLIEGLIPRYGVVAIAGSSDLGKSAFLRQMATEITEGKESFLGFKIHQTFYSCLYLSSEDDPYAMSYLLNKQRTEETGSSNAESLRFVFETDNVLARLESSIQANPVDCIFIDAFTDLYQGEMNASNKIRGFINQFRDLALKYECVVIFLHHTGKRTDDSPPSKANLLGSQGFEGKMRTVIELRKDKDEPGIRHLCIVKGNYIHADQKESSYVLRFEENMTFSALNQRVPFSQLTRSSFNEGNRLMEKELAKKYHAQGFSIREIVVMLQADGINVGKSTVATWTKSCPVVHKSIEKLEIGQEESIEDCPDGQKPVVELDTGQSQDDSKKAA